MLKNNKRNTKIVLAVIIVLIFLMFGFFAWEIYSDKFDKTLNHGEGWTGDENFSETFEENEFDAMHDVSDAASLDDLLKKWYNLDGSIMDQDYVINVLLLGIDGKNGVKYGGNSDSMILVSINKKTEKITLVSFMRDSRTYFEVNGRTADFRIEGDKLLITWDAGINPIGIKMGYWNVPKHKLKNDSGYLASPFKILF